MQDAEAFYLSRLKFDIVVYTFEANEYKVVDLLKLQENLRPGQLQVLTVYLGRENKLPVRLIIEKIPPAVADEKRRKLKSDKQNKRRNLSKERLKFCDINAYITNTDEEQLPAPDVRTYYTLRWQIEIIFKAWKTVYRIDKIKQMKIERFEAIHYGALILILLTNRLLTFCKANLFANDNIELSELKFFKAVKLLLGEVKLMLIYPQKEFLQFITLLLQIAKQSCLKEKKRTKNTPFLIIRPNP